MWPFQTDKCLIPFLGKPLLYHNLKQIKQHLENSKNSKTSNVSLSTSDVDKGGALEFIIVANPNIKEKVSQIAQDLGLDFQIALQKEPKGMADALLSAKALISGEVLVVNAEDQLDPSVYQGVLGVKDADVVVAGRKTDKYFPGGYLKIDGGKVAGIVEKPGERNEPSDLVKLVADYFRDGKKLVEYLEKATTDSDDAYEVALDQMIKDGVEVKFNKYDGIWIPLKYPWHILDITAHLLFKVEQQISPKATVSDKAIIEGPVVIEEGVKVYEGTVIKGPCYIGKNCIVGNNSLVRESNLEEGCVTGFSSDITRSYIGANSWFHTNYVGDSVLEGDFGAGSGAVLANLRLDDRTIRVGNSLTSSGQVDSGRHKLGLMAGRGVRIGANASVMPGVRVGGNCLVGPGVVLKKDLKESKKMVIKEESYEVEDYNAVPTGYDKFKDKLI